MTRLVKASAVVALLLIAAAMLQWSDSNNTAPREQIAPQDSEGGVSVPSVSTTEEKSSPEESVTSDIKALNVGSGFVELSDAFGPSLIHLGPATLDRLGERYFAAIDRARKGDGDAMLEVSRVLFNCQQALGYSGKEAVYSLFNDAQLTYDQYLEIVKQIDECTPIANDVLRDFNDLASYDLGMAGRSRWLSRSSEAGNKFARLELLWDFPQHAEEIAGLLDELVDTKDPQVLFKASEFVSVRALPEERAQVDQWALLGCRQSHICDESIFIAALEKSHSEADVHQMIAFVDSFRSLRKLGFSFKEFNQSHPYSVYTAEELVELEKIGEGTLKSQSSGSKSF